LSNIDAQNHAAELKLRAERKAGEILKQLDHGNHGGDRKSRFQDGILNEYREVLEEQSIASTTAHRWQSLAIEKPSQL
jgi:hypothetical protein